MRVTLLPAVLLCTAALAAGPAPDSLYQLDFPLTDQGGRSVPFGEAAKGPVLISMFYASCPHTCPIIITSMRMLEQQLTEEERRELRVLMVSFDPERDTPEKLANLAGEHRVDLSRWTFARPAPGDVRLLAAALDIRYRKLPDGEFNHSAVITLLDHDGRPVARTAKLGEPDADFVAALRRAVRRDSRAPHP